MKVNSSPSLGISERKVVMAQAPGSAVIEYPACPPSFSDDKNRTPPDSHHSAARNSESLYFEGSGYNLYHRHHTPIQCRQKIQQVPFHSVPKHSCPAA